LKKAESAHLTSSGAMRKIMPKNIEKYIAVKRDKDWQIWAKTKSSGNYLTATCLRESIARRIAKLLNDDLRDKLSGNTYRA
jgi:frataxin-like iron-binding protein CyaY